MSALIAPSILTADFMRLGEEIAAAERGGADWIHLDVMDGNFVPNITIGPLVAASVRGVTSLGLDAHLMVADPDRFIPVFAQAGVNSITVHAEATVHLHRTLELIRSHGVRAGVAINPATPVDAVREVLSEVDLVLVMSVNPGFGGQRFIERSIEKIRSVRTLLDGAGSAAHLQVDGGIDQTNVGAVVRAGATVIVAGSAVYNAHRTVAENLRLLREAATMVGGKLGTSIA